MYLWLNVQYRHEPLSMDATDGIELRAIHGFLVSSVLEVLILGDVLHHLLVRHEEVTPSVLLVFPRRPRRICHTHSRTVTHTCEISQKELSVTGRD